MNEKKYIDFMGAAALLVFAVAVILGSVRLYFAAGEPMYLSPGLLPLILGVALLFTGILYLADSLKKGGLGARRREIREWFKQTAGDSQVHRMMAGVLIMAIYIYLLLSFLPFWLASLIFMAGLMLYLKSASLVYILVISAAAVAFIVILFQVLFRVPLP